MKKLFKSVLVTLSVLFGIFLMVNTNHVTAANSTLSSGTEISVSPLAGNLNNINIKFEFTTSVNLDGVNNALLVGLMSSDGTVLTDTRFIGSSTNVGLYDEDGVALIFENAPSTIGTKQSSNGNYTYTFESRDFSIVNSSKNIAKLVIVAQKGSEIQSQVSISEVKYSVKFGDNETTLYSYNALITSAPTDIYAYTINGHGLVDTWTGNDLSIFVNGTTRATKNITYTGTASSTASHNWTDIEEVPGSRGINGTKAYQVCSVCGAKRLTSSSTTLATDEDLVLVHTCTYDVSFDWTSATNPGSKPVVTYSCNGVACNYSHTMSSSDVAVNEKEGSRTNPTCTRTGSVTFVASCAYEGISASEEKLYILPKTTHSMVHYSAVPVTCTTDGNVEYYLCSNCHNYYSDSNGINELDYDSEVLIPATGHSYSNPSFTWILTSNGYTVIVKCVCSNNQSHIVQGNAVVTSITEPATCLNTGVTTYTATITLDGHEYSENKEVIIPKTGHTEVIDPAIASTCTASGLSEGKHCSVCNTVLVAQEEVPALGHNYEWVIDKEATVTETGLKHEECTRCHDKRNENTIIGIIECEHNLILTPYVSPTCTQDGTKEYYTCSICGKHFSDAQGQLEIDSLDTYLPINATGHTVVIDSAVSPTCTSAGLTEGKHCSVCGEIFISQEVINALGHDLVDDPAIPPTCNESGRTAGHHCTRCDYTDGCEVLSANGHNEVIDPAVAPTCTNTGLTQGTHCSSCGEIFIPQETIPATGHIEVTDPAISPTCTEVGKTEGKHCSVCGTILVAQETIPATGHTEVIDASKVPTCTTTGLTEGKHCSVCGAIIVAQEIIPALGHNLVEDPAIPATCTESGKAVGHHCTRCSYTDGGEVIAATGHTEVIDASKAPTCTESGLTEGKHCSVCNTVLVAQQVIPATGHTEVIDRAIDPTCTEAGKTEGKHCSVCNEVIVSQETIPALGHNYEWVIDKEPTYNETGLKHEECTRCHETRNNNTIIDTVPCTHNLTLHQAVTPTCTTPGNIEYYECSICHKLFSDSNATNELTDVSLTGSHTLTHHDAVPATCTTDGVLEYYECSVCHKLFSDSECTTVITNTTDYAHHTYTKYDAVEPDCTTIGNVEYYYCTVCEKYFNMDGLEIYDPFLPYKHTLVKYNAKSATCTTDGNIEYYECSECHKKFTDITCTNEVTDVVIKSHGHNFGEDGRCVVCGKTDPDYRPKTGCKSSLSVGGISIPLGITAILIRRKKKYLE